MPAKKKRLLLQYQPTAGVNADFEQLLQRFTSTETVRFEKFAEIWRNMKMSFIFAGRETERECREYTAEILKMALKYLLPPYNFQVRVGGLYLLYGLFNQQPLIRKVRIRVTPDKLKDIVEFQREARRQQHLDVNYIFHKLRFDDAFLYVATDNEVSFHLNTISADKRDDDTTPEEFKEEQSILYDLFSDQFLEQLTQLHDHYHKVKVGLEGPEATEPSRSLNVIQTNIVPTLLGTIMAYQQRKQHRKGTSSDTEDELIQHAYVSVMCTGDKSVKSSLKEKAYRNVPRAHKSRRHRQAVDSTDESPEKTPRRGRKKKMSSDFEITPPKKRNVGRKKKVKEEEAASETAEVHEGETTGDEVMHMPSFEEQPSDNQKKKGGKERKKVTPQKLSTDDSEDHSKETVSVEQNVETHEGETTRNDVLHMPSFDVDLSTSGTQESSPKKKGRRQRKQVSPKKVVKGKMPSVRLKSSEKRKKPTMKVETNIESDDT